MEELREATTTDPTMQKLVHIIASGWTANYLHVLRELAEYFSVRNESQRVVVPKSWCHKEKSKRCCLLPTMTKDIELVVSSCKPCNSTKPNHTKEPMKSHWTQAMDTSKRRYFWMEQFDISGNCRRVLRMVWNDTLGNMTSKTVIMKMKRHFAVHGISELLMTDNATQIVSD